MNTPVDIELWREHFGRRRGAWAIYGHRLLDELERRQGGAPVGVDEIKAELQELTNTLPEMWRCRHRDAPAEPWPAPDEADEVRAEAADLLSLD